ncbi:MAG TPA: zinc-binding dehydrogenase [Longimicrobiales bacterium]
MRAAVLHGPGDLRVEDVAVPEPGPGEIAIRTLAASICNATDVHIWEGAVGEELRPPYPHVLGHERAGVVVAVGAGVTEFGVGDRVACWAKMDGAFGEYDVLRPWQYPTVKLSDGISNDAGSLLEFVGATLRCIHAAGLRPGERVLVLGQGVQGLVLAQEARLLGAGSVTAVDLLASRLERSRALGCDVAYDLSGKRYDEALADLRDAVGGEVDLVIDASGRGAWEGGNSVNLGLELLRWAGRYIVYGLPTRDVPVNARMIGMKGITFKGIDTPPHEVKPLLALGERWVAEGRLALESLVTHRVPLARVAEGLALCRDRPAEVLKVMVEFEG